MARKNKSKRRQGDKSAQPWFKANLKRQRKRDKVAKKSRKRNR